MKLLQEDPAETTRDILYTMSQQLANNSFPPFPQVNYETPQYAVVVNGLLFTSLSFSLVAALLAVLSLQWVASYDMGLNTSSARKRALQRHTRWKGIEKWKMGEIIASLPLLIFVSLFLFFAGIADWLWHLNQAISGVITGGLGIGFLAYSVTNVISIVKLDAPFRTPVSKGLAPFIRRAFSWTKLLTLEFPSEILKHVEVSNIIRWSHIQETWKKTYSSAATSPQNFSKYEELAIERKEEAAIESLIWLAKSIEISLASHGQFSILTKELSQLPGESLLGGEIVDQAPWESIFTMLSSPYLGKRSIEEYTADEAHIARDICKSFSMISSGIMCRPISGIFPVLQGSDPMVEVASYLMRYRHLGRDPFLLWHTVYSACKSASTIEDGYLHFILLTIQQSWSDLEKYFQHKILTKLIEICIGRSGSNIDPRPIPIKSLRIILDLVGRQHEGKSESISRSQDNAVVGRYLSAVQRMKVGIGNHFGDRIHRTIQQQLLFHLSAIELSWASAVSDLFGSLELLMSLITSRPLALFDGERDKFIQLLTRIQWESTDEMKDAILKALLDGLQYSYGIDDQPFNRWTSLILAFDEYLENRGIQSRLFHREVIAILCRDPPQHSLYNPEPFLQERLAHIKDPSIALWLAEYCPDDWQFEALTHPDMSKWNDSTLQSLNLVRRREDLIRSDLHISFLRKMIIDGPLYARKSAIYFLEEPDKPSIFTSEQVTIFTTRRLSIDLFTRTGCKYYPLRSSIESFNTIL
jgi:hypothetical protein